MNHDPEALDYVCQHNRLGCHCSFDNLSSEQKAFQMGAMHRSYGWAQKPKHSYSPEELTAYTIGFKQGAQGTIIKVGTRVKVEHGTGVVRKYEVIESRNVVEYEKLESLGHYRLMIELDPGHKWQTDNPDLLYCEWPDKVEVLDENA